MATANYDPSGILASFGGLGGGIIGQQPSIKVVGFMDGTFVECQRDEDAYVKKVGATGDVARAKNRNRSGSVKWVLLQTSPTNAQLSAYHKLGEVFPLTSQDTGQLSIKDMLGNTIVHAKVAWIKKVTNVMFGKEILGREWTFDCETLDMDVGDGGIF